MLHLRCWSKIRDAAGIRIAGIVDRNPRRVETLRRHLPRLGFADDVVCRDDLASLSKELDLSEVVVDVVTTNSAHHEVAMVAAEKGAQEIIIEKPIADTTDHARAIISLDPTVYVVENYLFSAITRFAKQYIEANGLRPCFAKTEFSKDRRLDSANGRGMTSAYTPHVFTVEMPHQIALVNHLLGAPESVYDAWCQDMILPDGRISDHGEGALTLYHGHGVASYNFSCLQGYRHLSTTYRTARIYCTDDTRVFCYYPATIDLAGSVLVYRNAELVEQRAFLDDSLTETLRYIVSCSGQRTPPINDAEFGYAVMDVIDHGRRLAGEYR